MRIKKRGIEINCKDYMASIKAPDKIIAVAIILAVVSLLFLSIAHIYYNSVLFYRLYFMLFNIVANLFLFLFLCNMWKQKREQKRFIDTLERHLYNYYRCPLKENKFASWIEKWGTLTLRFFYDVQNFPLNVVRLFNNLKLDKKKYDYRLNSCIDGLVVIHFVVSFFFYRVLGGENNTFWTHLFAGYCIWRISLIFFGQWNVMLNKFIVSINRTILLMFLIIFDAVFCYAYLYLYLGIVDRTIDHPQLSAFLYSLTIFTTHGLLGTIDIEELCSLQQFLIVSQLIVFVGVFVLTIASIFNLKKNSKVADN